VRADFAAQPVVLAQVVAGGLSALVVLLQLVLFAALVGFPAASVEQQWAVLEPAGGVLADFAAQLGAEPSVPVVPPVAADLKKVACLVFAGMLADFAD